jgi:hypothetical protein
MRLPEQRDYVGNTPLNLAELAIIIIKPCLTHINYPNSSICPIGERDLPNHFDKSVSQLMFSTFPAALLI